MPFDAPRVFTYDIRMVQSRLNQLGFGPLVVDGLKGPRTDAALVAFKRSVGLRDRPHLGPITWAALMDTGHDHESDMPWMAELTRLMGLHERRDRNLLMRAFSATKTYIDPQATAWCGALERHIMLVFNPNIELPSNPLGAKSWGSFGESCIPCFGCVLTFHRGDPSDWRGHVGNYVGESSTAFRVRGGNQSDSICDTWIAKSRLHSSRWPEGFPNPKKRIMLNSAGQPLSQNEA